MIELYQLEELVAFSECKTISKAAEKVGVSQPAFSRTMKILESEFGVPIFSRTSNSIELNETGVLAAEYAKTIVVSVSRAVDAIRACDRSLKTIIIGSVAPAPIWRVLPIIQTIFEDKTVAGEMKNYKELVEGLNKGVYKYIITTKPVSAASACTMRLCSENLYFCLPKDHRLAEESSLSFQDLDGENMLLYEHIGFWRALPEEKMKRSKFFIQSDREAFEELVINSNLPSFASNMDTSTIKGKVLIPIKDPEAHVDFYITGRKEEYRRLSEIVHQISTR